MKRLLALIFSVPAKDVDPKQVLHVRLTGFDPAALYSHDYIRRMFDELEPRK